MHPKIETLKNKLAMSVDNERKDGYGKSVSIATSSSGVKYVAGNITSDTNLLDISSEQAALLLSIQSGDFGVHEMVTLVEKNDAWKNNISPLTIKVIVDYTVRSGSSIAYTVIGNAGEVIFECKNIAEALSWYKPNRVVLERVMKAEPTPSFESVDVEAGNTPDLLKKYALLGVEKNFPTYDSASGYGAAALTSSGKIYWSGQYSSFEKRMNIHAEMGALISAVMHGETEIIAIGVVSTKHKNVPCEICGCCRQFLSEMADRFFTPQTKLFCFSSEAKDFSTYTIDELLPNKWSNKSLN